MMDIVCSICEKLINVIPTHIRSIAFKHGTACLGCVEEAKMRMLRRELKKMYRNKP